MNDQANTVLMNTPFRGLEKFHQVYFIGIGGIGMSAIARFFHSKGVRVSGYDKTSTVLTKELEASGIEIHYEDDPSKIPKDADLVIYTPAIPAGHKELEYYREHGHRVVKRSDVLQIISESSFNICIAGTHGKTTITTMVAHLLRDTGFGSNAFLGGISVNYGTNFWSDPKNVCVIEADEYDRSFLKLSPDIAIISAMDPDHLDIYGTAEAVEQAFIDFSGRIKSGGLIVKHQSLKRGGELKGDRQLSYKLDKSGADVFAENIKMIDGSYEFDAIIKTNRIDRVRLNMGGLHNVENVLAAITVASSLGIDNDKIKSAVASFRGVKRRFEYIVKTEKTVFVDDYAHHPEELRALITSAKNLFPDRKSTIIFQPHLYSRTQDFADGFAEVLDQADRIILLPIYPARELPIEGVNSEMIIGKMRNPDRMVKTKDEVLKWIAEEFKADKNSLLITAGAGDIDTLLEKIKNIIAEK